MKYCTHCGRPLDDNAVFCPGCGRPVQPAPHGDRTKPYLIWSIMLIVFCNPVATILGIIALVEVLSVHPETDPAGAEQKLRTVRTLCIVGTCLDAASLLLGLIGQISWLVRLPFQWSVHLFGF